MQSEIAAQKSNDTMPEELRRKIRDLSLQPLWESKFSLHSSGAPDDGNVWHWRDMRDVMYRAAEISSPSVVERRVVLMLDPRSLFPNAEATVGSITACFQLLRPGEKARPHRHSMNALRFVVESTGGAKTIVDGKELAMEKGDLVLTPGWCWHAHEHSGQEPVIWLDVLDISLHRFLGLESFQPGPIVGEHPQISEGAYVAAGLQPVVAHAHGYSPLFRYPWADAARAVSAAPVAADGARRVRYANPTTGGAALASLDMELIQVDQGAAFFDPAPKADAVFVPVEGIGVIEVGGSETDWASNDVISAPIGRPVRITNKGDRPARLFTVNNGPVRDKLSALAIRPV